MTRETDATGTWEVEGTVRVLVEPSAEYLASRQRDADAEAARLAAEQTARSAAIATLEASEVGRAVLTLLGIGGARG